MEILKSVRVKDTVSLKQQQDWQIGWIPESKNSKVKCWKKITAKYNFYTQLKYFKK